MVRNLLILACICMVSVLPGRLSVATTLDNLEECRAASTDNFSFKECVALQHQASEVLLAAIENSWREYLTGEQERRVLTSAAKIVKPLKASTDSAVSVESLPGSSLPNENGLGTEINSNSIDSTVVAIGSDGSASGSQIINITSEALLESEFPAFAKNSALDLTPEKQRQRFEKLVALFQQYREGRCAWDAGLYGADRVDVYITACNAWLNQQRAKNISLQLSEKRARDTNGTFFSGFYIEDSDGGIFQSCDRRQEWRIIGDATVVQSIATRYDAIARDNLEMAYLEMRGDYSAELVEAGFSGSLRVRTLNLFRAITEADCSPEPNVTKMISTTSEDVQSEADSVDRHQSDRVDNSNQRPEDLTVDSLGSSGFLYGYFTNWVSACAIEQNSVCMAQADSENARQGEWRLVVDRSLERQWRVQLIPTISDTSIRHAISIEIDGKIAGSRPVTSDVTTVQAEVGITLADGESARLLVNQMINGQKLSLIWSSPSENGYELNFSLVGVTRALEFFDQNG